MHSRERLVAAAALIGMALGSLASLGVLSACTPADKPKPDPSASASAVPTPAEPARLDPNDPAALQKAAEVIGVWQKKDPTTTAKVLKEQGVLITDPSAIQAIASAVSVPSASAPQAAATAPALVRTARPSSPLS